MVGSVLVLVAHSKSAEKGVGGAGLVLRHRGASVAHMVLNPRSDTGNLKIDRWIER